MRQVPLKTIEIPLNLPSHHATCTTQNYRDPIKSTKLPSFWTNPNWRNDYTAIAWWYMFNGKEYATYMIKPTQNYHGLVSYSKPKIPKNVLNPPLLLNFSQLGTSTYEICRKDDIQISYFPSNNIILIRYLNVTILYVGQNPLYCEELRT